MEISLNLLNETGIVCEDRLILTEKNSYTIGRKSDNVFKIKCKSIAKHHCTIHHNEKGLSIETLTFKKTLFVNDKQLTVGEIEYLNNGDIVKIGKDSKFILLFKEIGPLESDIVTNYEELQDDIYVKSEPIENRMENCEEASKILFNSTNSVTNQTNMTHAMELPVNSDHYPKKQCQKFQQTQDSFASENSALTDPLQISIDEHKILSSPPPFRAVTNSSALMVSSFLPMPDGNFNPQDHLIQNPMGIKVENPDIPPTNVTLFAKDPIAEVNPPQIVEDPLRDLTNALQKRIEKILESLVLPGAIKVENPDIPPTNLNLFAKNSQSETGTVIKVENPDIPPTNLTLFAEDRSEGLESVGILQQRIKEEPVEFESPLMTDVTSVHPSFESVSDQVPNETHLPKDSNQNLLSENLNLSGPSRCEIPFLEDQMDIDIEEHKPFVENYPLGMNATPNLRIRSDLISYQAIEPDGVNDSAPEIRVKEEMIETSFNIETDNRTKDNLPASSCLTDFNAVVKEEPAEPLFLPSSNTDNDYPTEVSRKRRRNDVDEALDDFRIKRENIEQHQETDEGRPIKRERSDSVYFSENLKQEQEDYSVGTICPKFAEREPRAVNLNTSQESDNSECSDCSTDNYEESTSFSKNKSTDSIEMALREIISGQAPEMYSQGDKESSENRDKSRRREKSKSRREDGKSKSSKSSSKREGRKEKKEKSEKSRERSDRNRDKAGRSMSDSKDRKISKESKEESSRTKNSESGKKNRESRREKAPKDTNTIDPMNVSLNGSPESDNRLNSGSQVSITDESPESRENYSDIIDTRVRHHRISRVPLSVDFPENKESDSVENDTRVRRHRVSRVPPTESSESRENHSDNADPRVRHHRVSRVPPSVESPENKESDSRSNLEDKGRNSNDFPEPRESDSGNVRINPVVRNYTGARVLVDDEFLETRERSRNIINKPVEKKKIGLAEYRNKKKDLEARPPVKPNSSNTVPLITFGQYRNGGQIPRGENLRKENPPRVETTGRLSPIFNELRTQPQGLRPHVPASNSHLDPRLSRHNNNNNPNIQPLIPPLISGPAPPLIPTATSTLFPSMIPDSSSIPGPLPMSATIPPGIPPLIANQIPNTVPPYQFPGAMNNFIYMPAGYYPNTYQFPYTGGQALDPRMNSSFSMSFPMNMPAMGENNTANLEIVPPKDPRSLVSDSQSPSSSVEIPRDRRRQPETVGDERNNLKSGRKHSEMIKDHLRKNREENFKDKKRDRYEEHRIRDREQKHQRNNKERERVEEVVPIKLAKVKVEKVIPKQFVSEDLGDEVLMKIFSWSPVAFERREKIPEICFVSKLSRNYPDYEDYKSKMYKMVLFVLHLQVQEAFDVLSVEIGTFPKCRMLEDIGQKIQIQDTNNFLVPLYVKIYVPISPDVIPPAVGDLLLIEIVNEDSMRKKIFGYMEKIFVEEIDINLTYKFVTYLVSVKEQKFDIHKCTIAEVKIVTNIRSFLEKARAIAHLQSTPLLPFIINPSMAFRQRLPLMQNYLKKDELVYQNRLDNQQLIAVAKVMRSYTTKQPEICIIEGTAGTGKTDVLVNIIFQLFFSLTTDEERANFRILVCTSSDAEIDAILNRVSKGIEELQMEKDVIKMVVIGSDEDRRDRTKEMSLRRFAKNHVDADVHRYQESMGQKPIQEQALFIEEQVRNLRARFEEKRCVNVYLQMSLLNKYYHIGKSGRMVKNMTPIEKKELIEDAEITFLAGANLIFSSIQNLSGTVMENFQRNYTIPVCIVDEATQIQELDALKAVAFKSNTLVLMGDLNKAPIMDVNLQRRNLGWENSLFYRIVKSCAQYPAITLHTQYRIIPEIEAWLRQSKLFQMNTLLNVTEEKVKFPLHPLSIFNLMHTEDLASDEVTFASTLMQLIAFHADLRRLNRKISIAIIICDAAAKERVETEMDVCLEKLVSGKRQLLHIEVGTIDKFQNYEMDIVLASCIRNKHLVRHAGMQRWYATITRAKYSLIIYGRYDRVGKFKGQCDWHRLVDYTKNVAKVSVFAEKEHLRRYLIR